MENEETRPPLTRERVDQKFQRAGHPPENKNCDHEHYDFAKHGRRCTCGTSMIDFGD